MNELRRRHSGLLLQVAGRACAKAEAINFLWLLALVTLLLCYNSMTNDQANLEMEEFICP